jgi:hypothetical protein
MHGFGHFHFGSLGGFLFVIFIALVVFGIASLSKSPSKA